MTNTLTQKLQILLLKIVIGTVWLFDWISLFSLSYFVLKLRTILVLLLFVTGAGVFAYVLLVKPTEQQAYAVIPQDLALSAIESTPSAFEQVLGAQDPKEFPVEKGELTAKPILSAKSIIAKDLTSNKTLFEKTPNLILAPASTTKLMTALVALEKYELSEVLSVPVECTTIDSTKAWLPAWSVFKVEDLLKVLLISSAGDAACTLGYGLPPLNSEGEAATQTANLSINYDNFVAEMNAKAKQLGMKNTFFTNTVGLDGYASSHYSTAEDLYVLAKEAVANKTIKDLVKSKEFSIKSVADDFTFQGRNTNTLLWELEGTVGVKTGTTVEAGEVLVYQYNLDTKNIMIVVMGSLNRFTDTKELLNWILTNYTWE